MDKDADVTATFTSGDGPTATLTTTLAGDAGGSLTTSGNVCRSGTCATTYLAGSVVYLSAAAAPAARFSGFSDGTASAASCSTGSGCTFTLSAGAAITGTFSALTSFTLSPSTATAFAGTAAKTFTATGTYSDGVTQVIRNGQGEWSARASMGAARTGLAAASFNGKVYAFGGFTNGPGGPTFGDIAVYDPVANAWSSGGSLSTPRALAGVAAVGNVIYLVGGVSTFSVLTPRVERYDPSLFASTTLAAMSVPRWGLAAGAVNSVIYAAGGLDQSNNPVATLEAYDTATDTWTTKAAMPTARGRLTGGVVNGIFYAVGGNDGTSWVGTVSAYDPATDMWTSKSPLPVSLAGPVAAVADGVLYVMSGQSASAVYAYDPSRDAWTTKAAMLTPRFFAAAATVNGVIYAIGGATDAAGNVPSSVNEAYVDALRWSSSASAVAPITAFGGVATPLAAGTTTISARVGAQTCGASCATFTVLPATTFVTQLSLDVPANRSTVSGPFSIGGWAINRAASSGTGVDTVHVYAQAAGALTPAVFLGSTYGTARPDIAALYGSQFANSGFLLQNQSLPAGTYLISAFAHDALTGDFDASANAVVTVSPGPSNPAIAVDTPTAGQTVTSSFEVGGWALDAGAPTGTGVDAVSFYVQPQGQPAPGVFVGTGSYGAARSDVAALYGSRFTDTGFHFTVTGLGPGSYTLNVLAHSTVTNSNSITASVPFTVSATALMSIDLPSAEATITAATFTVAGWSIDRSVESTALSGSGVDTLHVYAFPNPGSGQSPIFLGVATVGVSRPDVGAIYGSRYATSGYQLDVDRTALGLAPGVYNIAVVSHSSVSGTFNTQAVVRVTLQ